jgi:radical SAM superfamily enzyme YgiQ (UPF0313 family)
MMYDAIIFTDCWGPIGNIPAIGAYKCAHSLRKNGYTCLVVNHVGEFEFDELVDLLDQSIGTNTRLIGFSTTFMANKPDTYSDGSVADGFSGRNQMLLPQGADFEKKILQHIQDKNNLVKTVVGGTKATVNYSNRNIDYVCVGYSEVSVVNLMDHLCKGVELEHNHRNIFGRVILDDRYAPSYEFAKEDMEWLDTDVVNHKCLPLEIGRGCIFQCRFCSYPLIGKKNLDYVKSYDCLYKELQSNYDQFGVKNYLIIDDTFNDNVEKLKRIESVVSKLSFQPEFWAYVRLDLLCTRPETLDILYRIGVRSMQFGIETMHPVAAKSIGKGFDRNKLVAKLDEIAERYPDIYTGSGFIAGLPGESEHDLRNTLDRLISREIKLHHWVWAPLFFERRGMETYSSEFSRNFEKYGYVDQTPEDSSQIVNWKSDVMTRDKATELAKELNFAAQDHSGLYTGFMTEISTYGKFQWKDILENYRKFSKLDVHNNIFVEHVRPNFIKKYKKKLSELVAEKSTKVL